MKHNIYVIGITNCKILNIRWTILTLQLALFREIIKV